MSTETQKEPRTLSLPRMGLSIIGVSLLATFVFMGLGSILSTPVSLMVAAFLGLGAAKWATNSGIVFKE